MKPLKPTAAPAAALASAATATLLATMILVATATSTEATTYAGATAPTAPASNTGGQPNEPAKIWHDSCRYCHEATHFAPQVLGLGIPAALVTTLVRNGAPGMPPFHASEITDQELTALAQWIADSRPATTPP